MITYRKLGSYGQWGNQLFQFSGTRLYAELNKYKSSFPKWLGNEVFENIIPYSLVDKIKAVFLPKINIPINSPDVLKSLYESPKDNINFMGYMQDKYSLDLLKKYKHKVLKWFKVKKKIEDKFLSYTKKFQPWIGIHIRRNDFPKEKWIGVNRYKQFLRQKTGKLNLCVCSDDKKIVHQFSEYETFSPKNIFPDLQEFFMDFMLLKHATMVVGSGSTFSWWAGYLGNKNNYYSPPLSHIWKKAKNINFIKQKI
jgi:hypothetical protein